VNIIPREKKVKVQFVGGSTLRIGEVVYKKGDVLEISETLFNACPDLFVKVTEPKVTTTTIPEPTPEEEEVIKEIMEADTSTQEGKKKAARAAKKATSK